MAADQFAIKVPENVIKNKRLSNLYGKSMSQFNKLT